MGIFEKTCSCWLNAYFVTSTVQNQIFPLFVNVEKRAFFTLCHCPANTVARKGLSSYQKWVYRYFDTMISNYTYVSQFTTPCVLCYLPGQVVYSIFNSACVIYLQYRVCVCWRKGGGATFKKGHSGIITSHRYPGDYGDYENCTYPIESPGGGLLALETLDFLLEDCCCDYVDQWMSLDVIRYIKWENTRGGGY